MADEDYEDEDKTGLDLARRYRPETLEGYIGNEKMVDTVRRSFHGHSQSEWPRKIMVTGMTGCGKTTIARILVRTFLCENPRDGEPCDECVMCGLTAQYVKTGNFDELGDGAVQEVNVGSIRGVDAIERVTSTFEYPPDGRFKVYIFDEFQAASNTAQDSLLKKMEDLPDYVVLVFCTTDKSSVNDTIINRCTLDLTVRKPDIRSLMTLLAGICEAEGYKYERSGLRTVCVASNMIIRQSLQNLERVLTTRGDAREASVKAELDTISEEDVVNFFRCLLSHDTRSLLALVYRVAQDGNITQFLQYIDVILTRGILVVNGITSVEGLDAVEIQNYLKLFKNFTEAQLAYVARGLRRVRKGSEYTIVLDLFMLAYNFTAEGAKSTEDDTDSISRVINPADRIPEDAVRASIRRDREKEEESAMAAAASEPRTPLSADDLLNW